MLSCRICTMCSAHRAGYSIKLDACNNRWYMPTGPYRCVLGVLFTDVSTDMPPDKCPYAMEHIMYGLNRDSNLNVINKEQ